MPKIYPIFLPLLIVLNGIEMDSMNVALPDSTAFNRTKWN